MRALKGGGLVTLEEMHKDLLRRYYETTTKIVSDRNISDNDRNELLRDACSSFSFALKSMREASKQS